MLGKCAAGLAVSGMLALAPPLAAEHALPYRYTVLGYLKDQRGLPRPGVLVELTRVKTGFSYQAESDASGLYVVVARLGDESAGERLDLRVGGQSVPVVARFDPADHGRERGTRVDFLGTRAVERPGLFLPTLRRFLAE